MPGIFRMLSVACLVMHGSSIGLRFYKRSHLPSNTLLQTESTVLVFETGTRTASDFTVKAGKFSSPSDDNLCGEGQSLVTYQEGLDNKDAVCKLLSEWDIVRLGGSASISGSGYGCVLKENDSSELGSGVCAPSLQVTLDADTIRASGAIVANGKFPSVSSTEEEGFCSLGFSLVTQKEANANQKTLCNKLPEYAIVRLANKGSISGPGHNCAIKETDDSELGSAFCAPIAGFSVEGYVVSDTTVIDGTFTYGLNEENLCEEGKELLSPELAYFNKFTLCSKLPQYGIARLSNGGSMSGPGNGCFIKKSDQSELGNAICVAKKTSEDEKTEDEKTTNDEEAENKETDDDEATSEEQNTATEVQNTETEVQNTETEESAKATETETQNAEAEEAAEETETEAKLTIDVTLVSHKYPCPDGLKLISPNYLKLAGEAEYLWSKFGQWETARLAGGASVDSKWNVLDQDRRNLKQALCGVPDIPTLFVPDDATCPENYVIVTTDDIADKGHNAYLAVGKEGTYRTYPYGSVELYYENVKTTDIDTRDIEKPVCTSALVSDVQIVTINEEENCGSEKSLITIQEALDNRKPLCNLLPENGVARLAGGASIAGKGGDCTIKQYDSSDLMYVFCAPVDRT